MAEPFIGEVRIVGYNFASRGWAKCEGQLLPIAQYQALFSILGTTYGGDGRTTFGLPDLRGRIPAHVGPASRLGQRFGAEAVTLNAAQMPGHTHTVPAASGEAEATAPAGGVPAKTRSARYAAAGAPTSMPGDAVSPAGGGAAHDNMSPVRAMTYVIALQGLFPPRN